MREAREKLVLGIKRGRRRERCAQVSSGQVFPSPQALLTSPEPPTQDATTLLPSPASLPSPKTSVLPLFPPLLLVLLSRSALESLFSPSAPAAGVSLGVGWRTGGFWGLWGHGEAPGVRQRCGRCQALFGGTLCVSPTPQTPARLAPQPNWEGRGGCKAQTGGVGGQNWGSPGGCTAPAMPGAILSLGKKEGKQAREGRG